MTNPEDEPAFGYGRYDRPLWTTRDHAAEQLRRILRRAGHHDFTETRDGFVVEGDEDSAPFLVACTEPLAGRLDHFTELFQTAGYTVTSHEDNDPGLHHIQVRPGATGGAT